MKGAIERFLEKQHEENHHFDINEVEPTGDTALHGAIKQVYVEAAKFLIQRGAQIDATDADGHTFGALANVLLHDSKDIGWIV